METEEGGHRSAHSAAGVIAAVVGVVMLIWGGFAPSARGVFATQLVAEPGQNPMPSGVADVPENCKGIAPTPGSQQDTTQKQLNEGQGIVKPGPNSFAPGGTVHWLVLYNPTAKSASFDIRDCVVIFNPGNPNIAGVLALIAPNSHGQIIPTPGSEPFVKGFDAFLDEAEFDFPDNVALPGEFDLSWTVPNAPPGALICNYVKDTGGSAVGGKENRKAGGACFQVPVPPPTTTSTSTSTTSTTTSTTSTTVATSTTSTTVGSTPGGPPPPPTSTSTTSTSTTEPPTTSTTTTVTDPPSTSSTTTSTTTLGASALGESVAASTTTSVPTKVLGENFNRVAFTGTDARDVVLFAGALLASGGVFVLAAGRRRTPTFGPRGSVL